MDLRQNPLFMIGVTLFMVVGLYVWITFAAMSTEIKELEDQVSQANEAKVQAETTNKLLQVGVSKQNDAIQLMADQAEKAAQVARDEVLRAKAAAAASAAKYRELLTADRGPTCEAADTMLSQYISLRKSEVSP